MEKKDIALAQLRRAIQLFEENDFICATTLAGAAEEILGKLAMQRFGTNALDQDVCFWEGMADYFGKPAPEKKKIIDVLNRTRNELKHNDSGENLYVKADLELEAQSLIDRAISNYLLAYSQAPKDEVINDYIGFHWL